MKISLSWLREYLKTEQSAEQLAETLTRSGLEVKSIVSHGAAIPKVVAAQILESTQHPNADRLSVCKVDEGSGTPRQIVCGAKNYKVGDKVFLALPGAVLPGDMKIKVGKLRGVESEGMMCSSKELGLGAGVDGLHILPPETKIGTKLGELFPADEILELEITPNRPDWLGYLGVAREASVFGSGEFFEPSLQLPSTIEDKNVATITVPHACSFYSIRRIDNINMVASPSWLVQRLAVMEARSINLVVDLANYVMFETGQPLHAFDAAKIKGALNVRFAREGETLEALDGKTYKLRPSDLVIADENGPQALAGIIGGVKSGVTEKTTSILLESAAFDPATIAASLRLHGIHTEAGYRFERGSCAAVALEASARATALLVELSGGIASEKLFIAGQLPEPLQIELQGDQVRRLLGAEISDELIISYFKKLGVHKIESQDESLKNKNILEESQLSSVNEKANYELRTMNYELNIRPVGRIFTVPSWRSDLHRSVDLIEEVARVHGIEAIEPSCTAFAASSSREDQEYDQMMTLRRRLAAVGFFEARTGTLVAREVADERAIALRNPMGEQQAVLRTSLLPGLKKVLQHNLQQGASAVHLFEIGKVFQKTDVLKNEERFSLALIATGEATPLSWRQAAQRSIDFYDLKGSIDQLVPGKISYEPWKESLLPGMSLMVRVMCGEIFAGYVGLLYPAAARELMLTGQEYPVAVAELDVAVLCSVIQQGSWKKGGALPRFPAISRDLAFIVDKSVPYASLEEVLLSAKEELLRSVTPFDVFTDLSGEKIPADKKSVALSLKFQHNERTLTTEEVHEACERLIALLKASVVAEIRN